jgi:hypothetical protein
VPAKENDRVIQAGSIRLVLPDPSTVLGAVEDANGVTLLGAGGHDRRLEFRPSQSGMQSQIVDATRNLVLCDGPTVDVARAWGHLKEHIIEAAASREALPPHYGFGPKKVMAVAAGLAIVAAINFGGMRLVTTVWPAKPDVAAESIPYPGMLMPSEGMAPGDGSAVAPAAAATSGDKVPLTLPALPDADHVAASKADSDSPPPTPQASAVPAATAPTDPKIPELKGMKQGDAAGLYAKLNALKQAIAKNQEITPEMMEGLPPSVAKSLAGLSGAVAPKAPTSERASGVKLSDDVVNATRGNDGIPTIPAEDTWTATEGLVRLPLPGGGDVRSPDDLKQFGLKL